MNLGNTLGDVANTMGSEKLSGLMGNVFDRMTIPPQAGRRKPFYKKDMYARTLFNEWAVESGRPDYEPLRDWNWLLVINPPEKSGELFPTAEKFHRLVKSVSIPQMTIEVSESIFYGGAKRIDPMSLLTDTSMTVNFDESDSQIVTDFITRWMNAHKNSRSRPLENGSGLVWKEFIKTDIDLYVYKSNGVPCVYAYRFYDAFPTSFGGNQMQYDSGSTIITHDVNFAINEWSMVKLSDEEAVSIFGPNIAQVVDSVNGTTQSRASNFDSSFELSELSKYNQTQSIADDGNIDKLKSKFGSYATSGSMDEKARTGQMFPIKGNAYLTGGLYMLAERIAKVAKRKTSEVITSSTMHSEPEKPNQISTGVVHEAPTRTRFTVRND